MGCAIALATFILRRSRGSSISLSGEYGARASGEGRALMFPGFIVASGIIAVATGLALDATEQRSRFTPNSPVLATYVAIVFSTLLVAGWLLRESLPFSFTVLGAGVALLLILRVRYRGTHDAKDAFLQVAALALPMSITLASNWFSDARVWSPSDGSHLVALVLLLPSLGSVESIRTRYDRAVVEKHGRPADAPAIMREAWCECLGEGIAAVTSTVLFVSVIFDGGAWLPSPYFWLVVVTCLVAVIGLGWSALRAPAAAMTQVPSSTASFRMRLPIRESLRFLWAPGLILVVTGLLVARSSNKLHISWLVLLVSAFYFFMVADSLISNATLLHLVRPTAASIVSSVLVALAGAFFITWLLIVGLWRGDSAAVSFLPAYLLVFTVASTNVFIAVIAAHVLARHRPGESVTESLTEQNVLQDVGLYQVLVILGAIFPILTVAYEDSSSVPRRMAIVGSVVGAVFVAFIWILRNNLKHIAEESTRIPDALVLRAMATGEQVGDLHGMWHNRLRIRLWFQDVVALSILGLGVAWTVVAP